MPSCSAITRTRIAFISITNRRARRARRITMPTDAEKVVNEFCNAWPRKNIEEILGFFTEDAVYHNIPMEPARGQAAIRGVISTFYPMAQSLQLNALHNAP